MLSVLPIVSQAASYEVIELPSNQLSRNQFSGSIDNTGLILTIINNPYNAPIDISLLDLEAFNLTDLDSALEGNFNATDLAIVSSFIRGNTQSDLPFGQKLASNIAYQTDGTDFSYVYGFDVQSDVLNGFTFANDIELGDSVNGTHIVGTMNGPFTRIDYENENGEVLNYVVNDFVNRGFVQVGEKVTPLVPSETTAGGFSVADAINANLQVAGASSVAVSDNITSAITACEDEETRGDRPLKACIYSTFTASITDRFGNRSNTFLPQVTRRATIWQLDAQGDVIDSEIYGLTFEPDADLSQIFSNRAVDINDAGTAVGVSPVPVGDFFTEAAVVYENGVTTRLIADDELLPNAATGISNDGYVIGYRTQSFNGVSRTKFFTYDLNTDELVFPTDFFVSSASFPRAINNNNIVVGEGEADANQGERRRNGFMYTIETDTFVNLNDLLPCDSPYLIVTANDINDNNEIVADALVKKPNRDVQGNILLDENGDQVLVDTVVSVKLNPTGDAPSTCTDEDEDSNVRERQGASSSIAYLFGLLALVLVRRLRF